MFLFIFRMLILFLDSLIYYYSSVLSKILTCVTFIKISQIPQNKNNTYNRITTMLNANKLRIYKITYYCITLLWIMTLYYYLQLRIQMLQYIFLKNWHTKRKQWMGKSNLIVALYCALWFSNLLTIYVLVVSGKLKITHSRCFYRSFLSPILITPYI